MLNIVQNQASNRGTGFRPEVAAVRILFFHRSWRIVPDGE